MKNTLRILALLCALVMVLGAFAACGGSDEPETSETAGSSDVAGDSAEETTVETKNDADELGEYDFGRKDFVILARSSTLYEYDIDFTTNSSTVDQKVYERVRTIEDRFNVRMAISGVKGDDGNRSEFTTMLANSMQSGKSPWHMLSAHGTVISPQQFQGHCLDMMTLPDFDVTKEWWSSEFYEECNYDGRLYFAMGDIAYTMYEYLQVLFVNESLYEAARMGDIGSEGDVDVLYDMVRDGEWTYEVFKGLVKSYTGDQSAIPEEDREYGLSLGMHALRALTPATETQMTYRDEQGNVKLYEAPTGRLTDFYSDLKDFLIGKSNIYAPDVNGNDASRQNVIFMEGRALFYGQELGQAKRFSEMEQSYGVLPMPKYDELQDDYHSTVRNSVSAVMVPANVAEADHTMIGVIIEAMCMYGYQNIIPEYYDNTLSNRLLTGANGTDMLKIIRESFMIDFGLAYTFGFGTLHPYSVLKTALHGEKDLTTVWAEKYDTLNGKLQEMNNNIEKFYG